MCAFLTDGCAGRWDGTTNTSFRKILPLLSKMLTFICQSEYASSCTLHCICRSPIPHQVNVKEHFFKFPVIILKFSERSAAAPFYPEEFPPFQMHPLRQGFPRQRQAGSAPAGPRSGRLQLLLPHLQQELHEWLCFGGPPVDAHGQPLLFLCVMPWDLWTVGLAQRACRSACSGWLLHLSSLQEDIYRLHPG